MRKKTVAWVCIGLFAILLLGGCNRIMHEMTSIQVKKYNEMQAAGGRYAKFPEHNINFIVPYGAGGTGDTITRLMEKTAYRELGKPLAVSNKPGGGGAIGWDELCGASPDGYNLGITSSDVVLYTLYESGKYRYVSALDPLAQIAEAPQIIVASAKHPWRNMNELVRYAKEHPGGIKFGNWGVGTSGHVVGEIFAQKAGIKVAHVPFRGGSEMLTALLGGHVHVMVSAPAHVQEHVKAGTIRVMGVAGEHRLDSPVYKDAPTFKEQGLDIISSVYYGVASPKELPKELKAKLAEKFKAIITDPEYQKSLENVGLTAAYLGPKEAQKRWIDDYYRLQKVVEEGGIVQMVKEQRQ